MPVSRNRCCHLAANSPPIVDLPDAAGPSIATLLGFGCVFDMVNGRIGDTVENIGFVALQSASAKRIYANSFR